MQYPDLGAPRIDRHTQLDHLKLYERPVTLGMRLAAWATVAHPVVELLVLLVMIRQSAPGSSFLGAMAVEMSATLVLGLSMFRSVVIGYFVMGAYGMLRLLIAALAGYAIVTGEVGRVDPLLILGMVIAIPFALGWVVGLVAVWRARQRSARAGKSVVGAV